MSPYRVGILGCGSFANVHANIVLNLPEDVQLVALCDHHEANAVSLQAKVAPQAGIFTEPRRMFDDAALDLLIITLPPFAHTNEVDLAAEYGVHLLIEKPIALTSEKAWQMVEASEKAGIKTQVGFMYRFGEAVERYKVLQADGTTGAPGLWSANYFCNALHADWWRDREKSGGQVVEQVIHLFDLMRYMVGDPTHIFSRQENLFHREVPGYTVEDISATVARFGSGALGVTYASNNAIPGKWTHHFNLVSQHMTADFNNVNNAVFTHTNQEGNPVTTIVSERDFRRSQMLDLIEAIRTNGETRTPMREGAKTLDLVLAARRSAETGSEVAL